jgi:SAM-dependent methyltransferase
MVDKFKPIGSKEVIQRRVAGSHDRRMDGMSDLLARAGAKSVFDIGCNRGKVAEEFYRYGATKVHGCDIYELGITVARENFADYRSCESRFEVVDLSMGPTSLAPFAGQTYDITLCLATYHKLKRLMPAADLTTLMQHFGRWTRGYFGWRGTSDKPAENDEEIANLDRDLKPVGLVRIHTSYISTELGVAAIWART